MKTKSKKKTPVSPFDKMIDGLSRCFHGDSAKEFLKFRVDADLQKQIDELADKCNEGTLTPDERSEYGEIVVLDGYVAILKSKIRQRLSKKGR